MKPPWRDEAAAKLAELEAAKDLPISRENSQFALTLLDKVCSAETPMPWIVPGYDGELMLSWESGDVYVEAYIVSPTKVEVWRQTPETEADDGEDIVLIDDFSLIADWLKSLPPK